MYFPDAAATYAYANCASYILDGRNVAERQKKR